MFSLKAFSFLVKVMKSRNLTTTALLITMTLTALPARARSQADIATLNAQIRQATCAQDWGEAVKIVDQMLAITPRSNQTRYKELEEYRARMQNLSVSRTNVDSWLASYCTTPAAIAINTDVDSSKTTKQPSDQSSCSPAYPEVCIPDTGEDLNCADIPYSNVKVLPPDPHGFDGDSDGVGCES